MNVFVWNIRYLKRTEKDEHYWENRHHFFDTWKVHLFGSSKSGYS